MCHAEAIAVDSRWVDLSSQVYPGLQQICLFVGQVASFPTIHIASSIYWLGKGITLREEYYNSYAMLVAFFITYAKTAHFVFSVIWIILQFNLTNGLKGTGAETIFEEDWEAGWSKHETLFAATHIGRDLVLGWGEQKSWILGGQVEKFV